MIQGCSWLILFALFLFHFALEFGWVIIYNQENRMVPSLVTQDVRLKRVTEVCEANRDLVDKSPIHSQTLRVSNFLVESNKTRTVYCYIFKSAASTWMGLYQKLAGISGDVPAYK